MTKQKLTSILSYEERINRMLGVIVNNLECQYSLEELAGYAYLSPFHLHRIFSAMFGETLGSVVRNLRLYNAAYILKSDSERTVTDIAFSCGFSSSQNFARAFKVWTGISPSEYRKNKRLLISLSQNTGSTPYSLEYIEGDSKIEVNIQPNMAVLSTAVSMNVQVKDLPSYHVAYVSHEGHYNQCSHAWNAVMEWAGAKGLLLNATESIGVSYDNPNVTEVDKCHYDACVIVPEGTQTEGKVCLQDIPAGQYACYYRSTKLTDFNKAFNELMGIWLPQKGYECAGTPYEFYPNMFDCSDSNQSHELGWNVIFCMPVRKIE